VSDFPSSDPIDRRRALSVLGGAGAALLLPPAELPSEAATVACVPVTPQVTQGPYWVDEKLFRSDIRTDPATGVARQGLPLTLTINVVNENGSVCSPLAGAWVDIWHCDAIGIYSDEPAYNPGGGTGTVVTSGQRFLRGYQITDGNGQVQFTTIYPGWYSGRTIHIHARIRTFSGSNVLTDFVSQIFFDDTTSNQVLATAPYSSRTTPRDTTNTNDMVYTQAQNPARMLAALTKTDSGYSAAITMGATWQSAAATASATPISVQPASGSNLTETFTFTFTDTNGWQNVAVANILINSVLDGRQACYIAFVPSGANAGTVYLVDDAGDAGGPYSGMILPGNGTVSNSQCSIAGASSSVTDTGNTITLVLAITFTGAFAGNKVIYMSAQDKSSVNSGWQALGTWNVPGAAIAGPSVTGITPGRSTGLSETCVFTFSDSNGWQDIAIANILVNSSIDGRQACYIAFVPETSSSGILYLVDDSGDASGPYASMAIPGSGSVSNGQCTIAASTAAVNASDNKLTLTLSITFNASFAGNRVYYLAARSNTQNSDWQSVGSASIG
jgi:protocatechuate 3,4-dioxygenase beta subunit